MLNPQKKKATKWKISKLKKHPLQDEYFGDVPDAELEALAADMRQRGQRQPVEILPDGTIVAGHQRVRAAKLLGWREVEVIIRDDLPEQGEAEVESELIRDNLLRRFLPGLARAKCIKRCMELESGGKLNNKKTEEMKSKIAAQLHISPRNLNRYLLALEAPTIIQQAFDRGNITLINAGKVALLAKTDKKTQQEIVRRIEAGESAKAVVAEYLGKPRGGNERAFRIVADLARCLQRFLRDLDGRLDELRPDNVEPRLNTLINGRQLIDALIAKADNNQQHKSKSRPKQLAMDEEE